MLDNLLAGSSSLLGPRHLTLKADLRTFMKNVFLQDLEKNVNNNEAFDLLMDDFKLWCWRRLLRVPWAARRPNQSVLNDINLQYSLDAEAPILCPLDGKN